MINLNPLAYLSRLFSRPSPTDRSSDRGAAVVDGHIRSIAVRHNKWLSMFTLLQSFKNEHGHCRVPGNVAKHRPLYNWLGHQFRLRSAGQLAGHRLSALTTVGVNWAESPTVRRMHRENWNARLAELLEFKRESGHIHVSAAKSKTYPLASWLGNQRSLARAGKMPAARAAKFRREVGVSLLAA